MTGRAYYEAYEDRYAAAHGRGIQWAGSAPTPIVRRVLEQYAVPKTARLLEVGCGEGRDAFCLLDQGYDLLATDVSSEAVSWCRRLRPDLAEHFAVLDCLKDTREQTYDFIYAVAVLHMLVPDEDRRRFFTFFRAHLAPGGLGLVCSMGDGQTEFQTDIREAFELRRREHESGPMTVAATSCRMAGFATIEREIASAGLTVIEQGLTSCEPDFNSLLYFVLGA